MNFLASSLDRADAVPRTAAVDAVQSFGAWRTTHYLGGDRWTERYRAACGDHGSLVDSFQLRIVRDDLPTERERDFPTALLAREASVGRTLNRPRIAGPIALDLRGERPWLVTGAIGGPCLSELGSAPLPQRLWIVRQIAEELAALHASGRLHGRLDPTAITVSAGGSILLGELGLCRELGGEECRLPCEMIVFDPRYAAPEWVHEHGELTTACDRYALGAILFELLSGETPHARYADEELWGAKAIATPAATLLDDHPAAKKAYEWSRKLLSREPLRRPTLRETIETLIALEIESFTCWDAAA